MCDMVINEENMIDENSIALHALNSHHHNTRAIIRSHFLKGMVRICL